LSGLRRSLVDCRFNGIWFIGYGDAFSRADLKSLPHETFYTEPAGRTHFAETRDEPVVV